MALAAQDLGRTLENAILDLCCRLQPASPPPREIVLVGIDSPSFRAMELDWPWPRRYHARLIDRLTKAGAALIVFDVFFGEPSTPEDDRLLAEAVKKSGKVILARLIESTQDPLFSRQIILNPLEPISAGACGLGVSLLTPDPDGVVRHFSLALAGQKTLADEVLRLLKPDLSFPPDFSGLIRYAGPPQHLDNISYYLVLGDQELPGESIQDRVVLVGRMIEDAPLSQGQVDAFLTPYRGASRGYMSGVEIQANIINNLLTGTWGKELSWGARAALYLGVLLAFSLLSARLTPGASLALLVSLGLALVLGAWLALCFFHVWIQPVLLGAGLTLIYGINLFTHHVSGLQEKRWLHQAFTHYVPQEVVEALIAHPERFKLGGEELEATVMFADLAGFAETSKGMAPKDLVNLLSDYFTPLTDIILAHGGTLDKYMDSRLMAVWGAPLPSADHARRACYAALAMQRRIDEDLRERQARGQPFLGLSLGLHSGLVMAGNVGSRERFNYTIMGDTVNLTHRLQEMNQIYGTHLILSGATRSLAGDGFLLRELDLAQVRGRLQPVTIYELVWSAPGDPRPLWLSSFEEGRAAYLRRDWRQAALLFEEVIRLKPQDGPATLYLQRCRRYHEAPPPPDWEGVAGLEGA
ncbi:MAG: adenylate/guanylate cyclase domain-containing protein, partial [Desulfobaccales bacterium]